jgi:hypothetical protein
MFDDFDGPAHLLLNLAVGGSWPGNGLDERLLPATLLVDWVRARQRRSACGTPASFLRSSVAP